MNETKSVQEQLEEIAARRKARREAAGAGDDEARELERAQAIDAAEEKYETVVGKGLAVIEVVANGPIVIVKKPANATYRKFQDSNESGEVSGKALVKPCVVYPESDVYAKILDEYPAVLIRLVKACARMAGFAEDTGK